MATKKNVKVAFTNSKEFNKVANNSFNELDKVQKSPFAIVNYLNKVVKGTITNCSELEGFSVDNIKAVAKAVKTLHEKRDYFSVDVFYKDYRKEFCVEYVTKPEIDPIFDGCSVFFDSKGNECTYINGTKHTQKPVPHTNKAYLRAFAKLVRMELVAKEKATKKAETDAKKAKREASKKAKQLGDLFLQLNSGKIAFGEYVAKREAIEKA